MQHTFIVYVDDKPGVLNRVASLFRRRAFNINSLTVGPTHRAGISRMTITMDCEDEITAHRVESNMYKLVNVLKVDDVTHRPSVDRDLLLVKVGVQAETQVALLEVIERFRCHVVDLTETSLIVECTGPEAKIDELIEAVKPYGIIEMARTGLVSMLRGAEAMDASPDFVAARLPEEMMGK